MTAAEKLTLLANEVRELSGTTDLLGLDDMTAVVSAANDEITTQENTITSQNMLIADIVSALEGKSAGGGGVNVPELYTVTYESSNNRFLTIEYLTIDDSNTLSYVRTPESLSGSIEVIPNSWLLITTSEAERTVWGDTEYFYPSITDIQGSDSEVTLFSHHTDPSLACVLITYSNHIIIVTE